MDSLTTDGADFWLFGYGYASPTALPIPDSCPT